MAEMYAALWFIVLFITLPATINIRLLCRPHCMAALQKLLSIHPSVHVVQTQVQNFKKKL